MHNIEIGKRIRAIRIGQGMQMQAFSELIGVSRSLVCKWELGYNMPNNARLKVIAEIGGVPVSELLYGKEVPQMLGAFVGGLLDATGRDQLGDCLESWDISPEQFREIQDWLKKNADIEVEAWQVSATESNP